MKKKILELRTIDKFESQYFPKQHERKMIEKLTPKECGIYRARQILDYIGTYIG